MAELAEQGKKSLPRRMLGEGFVGLGIVAAIAAAFFVFYVTPQSQYERERIYRSMNDVSRLLDDKAQAAEQAFQSWNCTRDARGDAANVAGCYENLREAIDRIETESQSELPGFAFGCTRKNIICLGEAAPEDPAARLKQASITLQSIAEGARLPYPQAILLIMSSSGQIMAGYDEDGKWLQFQSLDTLIDRNRAVQAKPLSTDELSRLLGAAQRSGRGAENAVFEGYPARLSRDIGGQGYSIFMAAHELGRLRANPTGAMSIPVTIRGSGAAQAGQGGGGTGNGGNGSGGNGAGAKDVLYFAYVVPDNVIDGAALRIPSDWTVNLLLVLVCALLAIPFLKLFNRSPLKAIRVVDLAAILISTMLVITTVTLLLTAVLLRNSVAQDIERELSFIADKVSRTVAAQAASFKDEDARLDAYVRYGSQWVEDRRQGKVTDPRWPWRTSNHAAELLDLAPLQSSFVIGPSGKCAPAVVAAIPDCGAGIWFAAAPLAGQLNIVDRAYLKAWASAEPLDGSGKYVQFLRSKSNGKLSWSYILEAPAPAAPTQDLASGQAGPAVPAVAGAAVPVASGQRRGFVISAMPLALRAPVLPRNAAFMIVLNTNLPDMLHSIGSERLGDVQYHSDQSRSLIENVLREARDDPRLAAALWALRDGAATPGTDEQSQLIPITYHGRNHFALVRPIPGMPLSVIALFDRTEAQGLFAQTVAQAFFLSCCWILLCLALCWITPRAMRWTLDAPTEAERVVPLRGRSIWFFPNGLFTYAPDGFSYASRASADEVLLVLVTLAIQAASFLLLPPGYAVIVMALISLVALVGHYLLIARPHGGGLPAARRRALLFLIALCTGIALFAALTRNVSGGWVFLAVVLVTGAAAVMNLVLTRRYLAGAPDGEGTLAVPADRPHMAAIRRAFLMRAIILLTMVVAIPTVGFMTLIYSENLKGYVGASLITAAERIAEQRKLLRKDLEQRFQLTPELERDLGLAGFEETPPGWFLSGAGDPVSGIFSVTAAREERVPPAADPRTLVADFMAMMTPHYASSNSEVRDSAERVQEISDDGGRWLSLAHPQDFVAPGVSLSGDDKAAVLRAGPIERLAIHPDWTGRVSALLCLALFAPLFYGLVAKIAAHLTGLYLAPVGAEPAVRAALDALIARSPAEAWAAISDDGQRARLLALAFGRTINFSDRAPIQKLVEQGYLELTPYVRIANDDLRTYLRYDLPREQCDAALREATGHDDQWEHMRLPVFVGLGAACVLLAYTSPNAIQLVMSAFLALTALLPLTQDPISRFLGVQRG